MLDCLDRRSPLLEGFPPPQRHRLNEYDCGHLYAEETSKPDILRNIPRRFKRYGPPCDRVEQFLREPVPPDVVFVTCMATYWYSGAFSIVRLCKSIWPEVPVVLGGIYPLLCPEHAREHSEADVVVTEPGWETVIKSASAFLGNPSSQQILEACTEPIEPDYDKLTCRRSIPLLTRSGCPFRCTYCASEHLHPTTITFPPDWVVDQLERGLPEESVVDVAFFDDALLLDSERHSKPIFEGIIRKALPARFHTPNALHVSSIDRELADLMFRAGVRTIRLGLESDDPDFQRESGGKVTTDDYVRAVEHLRAAGYTAREIGTYILAGLPGQTLDSIRHTAEAVHRVGSEIRIAFYSPTPKTALFSNTEGFSFDPSLDPLLQNDSLALWRSALFTSQEFREMRSWIDRLNDLARKGRVAA